MSDDFELRETHSDVSVEWKIKEFFSLPKETGYSTESPTFLLSDTIFYLSIYPNGKKDKAGWVSLFLHKKDSSSQKYPVVYTLGIRKCDGSTYKSRDIEYEFEISEGYGYLKLVQTSDLTDSNDVLSSDGSLTIFCDAKICMTGKVVETASQTSSSESFEILQQNFRDLFLAGHHGDVTIKVDDQQFQVHRSILAARSPVFFSMFDHDTEEKRSGIVNISDCDPQSFKDFLVFLYTGNIDVVSSSNAVDLYKAADKYDLNDLRNECVRCMSEELSVHSFCDVILLATMHNESDLLNIATDFFIENVKTIFPTTKWQSLADEHSALRNELLVKMANTKF